MSESTDSGPKLSSMLIHTAALLTPSGQRERWLKEWLSELWHAYFGLLREGVEEDEADRQLLGVCAGAYRDAGYLRLQWLRSVLSPKQLLAHPRNALLLVAVLGLAAAAGTDGFSSCREALRG